MSNVPRIIFERLRAGGLSPQAAAGLVGNIGMESSFNTGARNPGDGRDGSDSIGLSQWNGTRAQALKQLAAQRGVDWRDPALQADFIVQELNSTEKRAKAALEGAADPRSAGAAAIGYFRPAGFTWANPEGGHNASRRIAEAERYANEFGGLPAQTGVAGTSAPMRMPDLTAPAPAPQAVEPASAAPAEPSFDFGKAIAMLAAAATPQQTQQSAQKAPAPSMPALRQQPRPVQVAERSVPAEKKVNLGAIFGV